MKRIILVVLLVLATSVAMQAQKTYSVENLEKASQEELDLYLNKAMKLQKTGRTMNIAGGSVLGVSALGLVAFGDDMGMGALLFVYPVFAGVVTMSIGIPKNLTGKKRVERIKAIKSTAINDIVIDLKPCVSYSQVNSNYHPGFTLRIRF